jgi:molybdopterin-guanine dinucleotide biosynthesis protein B
LKIISLIGFSGSGKTKFILNAIKLLKKKLNYHVAVIKNIHEHQIDEEGKDSYMYVEKGAQYSITKNINNETTIFLKEKITVEELKEWIIKGPFKVDVIFTEGFRELNYPTVLCLKKLDDLNSQLNKNVRMISGVICSLNLTDQLKTKIPILDIEKDFNKFLEIFNIN